MIDLPSITRSTVELEGVYNCAIQVSKEGSNRLHVAHVTCGRHLLCRCLLCHTM